MMMEIPAVEGVQKRHVKIIFHHHTSHFEVNPISKYMGEN